MKRIAALTVLLVLLIGLIGCTSAQLSTPGPSKTEPSTTQTQTAAPPKTEPPTTQTPTTVPPTTVPDETFPALPTLYDPNNPIRLTPDTLGDRVYVYEKDGPVGFVIMKFYLILASDGTFQYHESPASSHIGMGTWSVEGDVLTLTEERYQKTVYFYFRITEEALVFMEENEDNFSYPKVSPGERFYAIN